MSSSIPERIKAFNLHREKEPLQLKYAAMAESPFRFFRGSCFLFYEELLGNFPFPASPAVWACGDLHIENFGSYKGGNGLVYFDMNDFDEAMLTPLLWEISRLTASVQIGGEEAGFSGKANHELVDAMLQSYRQHLQKAKPVVIEQPTATGLIKKLMNKVANRSEYELLKKRTDKDRPERLEISDRLFALAKPEKKALIAAFDQWLSSNGHRGLETLDAGFRIAGTGSIGVKRYLMLLAYSNNKQNRMLVDLKQALPSSLMKYAALPQPAWRSDTDRVTTVQEMMQHVSPSFLSSFSYEGNWFVVKELQPMADKVNLPQAVKQSWLVEEYITDLGMLTAAAQLRSSGRKRSATADELQAFAEKEDWVKILADWSLQYAGQVKKDYAEYKEAWENGFFNE